MNFVDTLPPPIQLKGHDVVVFTPSFLVDKVLDDFPDHVWSDKNLRWLVPVSKNGVWELGIYVRLMNRLKGDISLPSFEARREWIMSNMITSFCSEELLPLVKRNFLGKVWNDMVGYDARLGHVYATNFLDIHVYAGGFMAKVNDAGKKVKFDCIVGNPPYQKSDGGFKASAGAFYPAFVLKAMECEPKYMSMVIPAKWMSGDGKGTTAFLKKMLECKKLSSITTEQDNENWFEGIDLKGGAMYFLYDAAKSDSIVKINGDNFDLSRETTIVVDKVALGIKVKVLEKCEQTFDQIVFGRNPYDISTNHTAWDDSSEDTYPCHCSGGSGKGEIVNYISKQLIVKSVDTIPMWKVCIASASGAGKDGTGHIFMVKPNAIMTDSYYPVFASMSETEAKNAEMFLNTKTAQFLISVLKGTHHMPSRVFGWLPVLDFTRAYTDADLYDMFGLSPDEIKHIENFVKDFPMFREAKAPKVKPAKKSKKVSVQAIV